MYKNYGRQIKLAANKITRAMDQYATEYGLTGTQLSVIDFVANTKGNCLQRDIEHEFSIQRSTATVLLQRMENHGLINTCQAITQDTRQKEIMLTDEGLKLRTVASKYINKTQKDFMMHFSTANLVTFEIMLNYWIEDNNDK